MQGYQARMNSTQMWEEQTWEQGTAARLLQSHLQAKQTRSKVNTMKSAQRFEEKQAAAASVLQTFMKGYNTKGRVRHAREAQEQLAAAALQGCAMGLKAQP
jgi:hypothetical protein